MASDGGAIIASRGVKHLFTLCGGHISPILVGAEANGLRVVDVRDEASAVFAADAVARMTGIPGVAAVTAGPGVTNTITAVKNAQMAQSPIVIFGGAAATLLSEELADDWAEITYVFDWIKDPLYSELTSHPGFAARLAELETERQAQRERVIAMLESRGL